MKNENNEEKVEVKAKKINEKGKEKSNIGDFIANHKAIIMAFICGVLITAIICGILWPDRIAKLSDGSEVVASVNGTTISADSLYKELSDRGGLSTLLEMLDKEILKSKYNLETEAREYALEKANEYYEQWESIYGYTKEEFLSNNAFKTEEDFYEYLEFEYYKDRYFDDYLKSKVKEEDVKAYYDDVVKDPRYAYVFYAAEESNNLSKVKKYLDKGKSIDDFKERYDDISYRELGTVDFNSYNIYTEKFLKELNKLGRNESSKVFEDENFGFVVIYVTDVQPKESYDDTKEQITSNLANELYQNDQNLYYRAFQELRKEYELVIEDSKIKAEYEDFIKQTKEVE